MAITPLHIQPGQLGHLADTDIGKGRQPAAGFFKAAQPLQEMNINPEPGLNRPQTQLIKGMFSPFSLCGMQEVWWPGQQFCCKGGEKFSIQKQVKQSRFAGQLARQRGGFHQQITDQISDLRVMHKQREYLCPGRQVADQFGKTGKGAVRGAGLAQTGQKRRQKPAQIAAGPLTSGRRDPARHPAIYNIHHIIRPAEPDIGQPAAVNSPVC